MTKTEAMVEIGNRVYKAVLLFEELENKGLVVGNGHHMAQAVVKFAEEKMYEVWKEQGDGETK